MRYIQILSRLEVSKIIERDGYKLVKFNKAAKKHESIYLIPQAGIYEIDTGIQEIELLD
jgi:hypothetical protein